MTFEEALAAPGKLVQVWGSEVIDGQLIQMIYRLADDGAKQLAWRHVPAQDQRGVQAACNARKIADAAYNFYCDFVWMSGVDRVEVYDRNGKIFDAAGDYATLADGRVVARADVARVYAFANADYIWRGVKAILTSGQEIPLVTEASGSAMGDPTYSRNELLQETTWAPTIGAMIATWAGVSFEDRV